jgi:hypothetical protein
MAVNTKLLARTTVTTSPTTLYTAPASTTTVVTNVVIANNATVATTAYAEIQPTGASYPGGVGPVFIPNVSIAANSFISIDIKQTMNAADILRGSASQGDLVSFHISGVEIV